MPLELVHSREGGEAICKDNLTLVFQKLMLRGDPVGSLEEGAK